MDSKEPQLLEKDFAFNSQLFSTNQYKSTEMKLGTKSRWLLKAKFEMRRINFMLEQVTNYFLAVQCLVRLEPPSHYAYDDAQSDWITDVLGTVKRTMTIPVNIPSVPYGLDPFHLERDFCTIHCSLKVYELDTSCPNMSPMSVSASDLITDFRHMLNNGQFSDCSIITENQIFPVHRNILSARSSVFRAMFQRDMAENNTGKIVIEDFGEEVVKQMLIYIYSSETEFECINLTIDLLKISDKYDLRKLSEHCCRFLGKNLELSTILDVLKVAFQLSVDWLRDAAADFVIDNMDKIKRSEVQKLEPNLLECLLYQCAKKIKK